MLLLLLPRRGDDRWHKSPSQTNKTVGRFQGVSVSVFFFSLYSQGEAEKKSYLKGCLGDVMAELSKHLIKAVKV